MTAKGLVEAKVSVNVFWNEVMEKACRFRDVAEMDERGWLGLLVDIDAEVKRLLLKLGKRDCSAVLGELKTRLMTELSIEEALQSRFAGDFAVYKHFLMARLVPVGETLPVLSVDNLWNEEVNPIKRYQDLIGFFLNNLVKDVKQSTYPTFSEVRESLVLFKSLSRLSLTKKAEATPSILERSQRWFLGIVQWFRALIHQKASLDDKDYVAVCCLQRGLLHEFGLDKQGDAQGALSTIQASYQALAIQEERRRFYYQAQRPLNVMERVTGILVQVNAEWEIGHVIKSLEGDLSRLSHWSEMVSWGRLLLPSEARAKVYLEVYWQVQKKFDELSEGAFRLRMLYESKWHGVSSARYLGLLTILDEQLLTLHEKINEARKSWREGVERYYAGDSFYLRANEVFSVLESDECVRGLQAFHWVRHTGYCWLNTEQKIAYEMEQREALRDEKRFVSYDLNQSMTLSDFAIGGLPEIERGLRKIYIQMSPDKVSDEEERAIREGCFKQLEVWKNEAKKLAEQWKWSQWAELTEENRRAFNAAALTSRREATRIGKPDRGLDLSVLVLKEVFLKQTATRLSLVKAARGDKASPSLRFCKYAEDAILDRIWFAGVQDDITQREWDFHEMQRNHARLESKGAELAEQLDIAMRNILLRSLKGRLGLAVKPDELLVRRHVRESVTEVFECFGAKSSLEHIEGLAYELLSHDASFASISLSFLQPSVPSIPMQEREGLHRYGTFATRGGASIPVMHEVQRGFK